MKITTNKNVTYEINIELIEGEIVLFIEALSGITKLDAFDAPKNARALVQDLISELKLVSRRL